ncbi:hypothetical protein GCM10010451_15280 [Streptomyces virens]|uniref:Uncharacterized protein n=1 Tax=Streptomyces virens TaxID=285572 RepID=A0ABP6P584_9ACTN|nr:MULTISPECIES: hypothetical protein [Streptomyces]MBA8975921.1 hypothetical protein [Streptomyces calvus]MYS31562.1 hypothetical protein [Streptomyces sp. SID7804]
MGNAQVASDVTFAQVEALLKELEAKYEGTRFSPYGENLLAGGDTNSCHSCINCRPEEQ